MRAYRSKNGFTIIELLIGISITAIIFTGASSLIFSLFTSDARNQQIDEIEQAKNSLQGELSDSIRWAQIIQTPNLQQLTITSSTGEVITYVLENKQIVKKYNAKTVSLTPENVIIDNFDIDILSNSSNSKSIIINVEMTHAQKNTIKDVMRLVTTQRVTSLSK